MSDLFLYLYFVFCRMKLEDEIVQSKFKSEFEKALINIIYTYNWLSPMNMEVYTLNDISPQQYNILRILRGQHPNSASVKLLRERMLDKNSDTSRLVDRLFKKKLVERTENKMDRRLTDVKISTKGLKLLDKLNAEMTPPEDILKGITATEAKQLNALLDKCRG